MHLCMRNTRIHCSFLELEQSVDDVLVIHKWQYDARTKEMTKFLLVCRLTDYQIQRVGEGQLPARCWLLRNARVLGAADYDDADALAPTKACKSGGFTQTVLAASPHATPPRRSRKWKKQWPTRAWILAARRERLSLAFVAVGGYCRSF